MTALWSNDTRPRTIGSDASPEPGPAALTAAGVTVRRGGLELLRAVDVALETGRVLAVAGGSGAGKTTLLRVLAGLDRPTEGSVVHHGAGTGSSGTALVGFVPQDDIVHTELSVRSTLRYAASLRLRSGISRESHDRIVDDLMVDLGLDARAEVRVGSLSGGQRKRVSIAVELLSHPDVLLLDEPTSGLDPASAADVIALLHRLAGRGVAIGLTTHREADIEACDRVLFLAGGGVVAFDGALDDALDHLGVNRVSDVYAALNHHDGRALGTPPRHRVVEADGAQRSTDRRSNRPTGPWGQVRVLTRRNAEVMVRNRLTLAVLIGSPVLVTAMMATLFQRQSFGSTEVTGLGPVQVTFWLAFAGFFFGLTYGLLQVVVERPVLERERFAGVRLSAYVASKVLVLTPLLTAVAVVLLGTLRALGRIPDIGWTTMAILLVSIVVESLSALALGLLASSSVRDPAQATLALPMLCFPQVLFAGAVVPITEMTGPGAAMSTVLANRWAFEALGRGLGLGDLASLPGVAVHGSVFDGSPVWCWAMLATSSLVLLLATGWVLHRTTPRPTR
jgi:ABC transport system ATP-binding/permease protein